ncbi:hypothetical protein JQ599_14170 [Bradyrhizobium diazoefficiens]|uniref:DUF5666 domain-containing protein n=1 Tax=Bradyrhizobium centrosematis TaxID=1300039 RepID=UPI001B8A364E|nr:MULTISPECIES: DUF5666 domain-containing protein [Bradyrhizobium]MBR0701049.1 hypothetical protein [Bradyrhizobium diazoefficiens]MBR0769474.1 hypothetical protein [Bradyrhizobium diazoefficiens]MCS3759382.1 hypothetical protein [Bradyrhizobium centrosematis]MCS3772728.1 hypothetical protein [Bradyrhizobium centrosematis]
MSRPPLISRRLLLTGFWLAGTAMAHAQVKRGTDQGIGGTGITRGDDHGIGGTGIVGVIQRFGSIYVNGERITYASDVPVRIDGEAASAKALRIGQLARVVAVRQADGTLVTRNITIASEVAGPVEQVKGNELTVLGQKIVAGDKESKLRPGTQVAVYGLRRTDGVVVASLVELRRAATERVTGLVERGPDGLRIGGLKLNGVDPLLVGQRVQVEGSASQGAMQATRTRIDDFSDLVGASRLSVEAYVQRAGANLQLGSGLVARDGSRFGPAAGEARMVINGAFDRSRGFQVDSAQAIGQGPGAATPGGSNPNRSPGGSIMHPDRSTPHPGGSRPGAPGVSPPGSSPGPNPGSAPTGPGGPSGPGGMGSPGGPMGPGGGMGGGGFGGPGGGMGGGRR